MKKFLKFYTFLLCFICLVSLMLGISACTQTDTSSSSSNNFTSTSSNDIISVTSSETNSTTATSNLTSALTSNTTQQTSSQSIATTNSINQSSSFSQEEVKIIGVELSSTKLEYKLREDFDLSTLSVSLSYSNGTSQIIDSDKYVLDYSCFNPMKLGEYEIMVTVPNTTLSTTLKVNVKENKSLKLLMIGNSFSHDAITYTYEIAKNLGFESVKVVNMFIGGCWVETHYNNILNPNDASYIAHTYENGKWIDNPSQNLRTVLASDTWDVITLQEASGVSGLSSADSSVANYDHLKNLERLGNNVLYYSGNKNAKLVWHMTWAYQQDSNHADFARYNKDQTTMYNSITNVVQNEVQNAKKNNGQKMFSAVIPSGTAIQNTRTSFFGDTLTRDGYHLSLDYGRYIASLSVIATLTGVDVSKVTYVPNNGIVEYGKTCIEAVQNALKTPYSVTKSSYTQKPILDLTNYEEVALEYTGGAYWNPNDATNFNNLFKDGSDFCNTFVATKRFTKAEIPVGSIIMLTDNTWKYRPDAWIYNQTAATTTRDGLSSLPYLYVTEEWWSGYEYRAFNISKLDGTKPNNYSDVEKIFKILRPKTNGYATLNYTYTARSYWNPEETTFNTLKTGTDFCGRFIATQRFTKQEIPIGSIIVLKNSNWQYRPDKWTVNQTTASPANSRENITNQNYLIVTEEWWAGYEYRAFNLSIIGNTNVLTDQQIAEIMADFIIYTPNK